MVGLNQPKPIPVTSYQLLSVLYCCIIFFYFFYSFVNAQALIKLCQPLAAENKTELGEEIFNAVNQYKHIQTIHSSTEYKPEEVFYNREKYLEIRDILNEKQDKPFRYHNKKRQTITYKTGETVYVKADRRNNLAQ